MFRNEEKAMKWTYQKKKKKSIDLAPLGFEKGAGDETYFFCTPRKSKSSAERVWMASITA